MRIALSGSSSTGKTTLALAVSARRPELVRLNADARSLLNEMGMTTATHLEPHDYSIFQRRYLARKFRLERQYDNFITDRSFVDGYAYWLMNCHASAPQQINEQMLRLCRTLSSRYDQHFFLPYGLLPHADDGWRNTDRFYHQAVSERILRLLCEWGLRHEVVESLDLDERVEQILASCLS